MNGALGPFSQMLRTKRRDQCQEARPQVPSQKPDLRMQGPDCIPAGHTKPTPAWPSPAHPPLQGPTPPWATCGPCRGLLPGAHHPWVRVPSPPCSLASQPWPARPCHQGCQPPDSSPSGSRVEGGRDFSPPSHGPPAPGMTEARLPHLHQVTGPRCLCSLPPISKFGIDWVPHRPPGPAQGGQ